MPVPTSNDKVLAGVPVDEAQLAFLVPGVTTKAEVLERLGKPALIWENARLFAYPWEMRQGILFWAAGAYYTGAFGMTDLPKHYLLVVRFDEEERVQRFSRLVRPWGESFAEVVREWLGEPSGASPEADDREADEDNAVVLMRIELAIDGLPEQPFPRPSFNIEPLFAFGLGNLETAGAPSPSTAPQRFLSDQSRLDGWAYFRLAPGTWYLAVIGPDSSVTAMRGSTSFAKVLQSAPRWRIDVPEGARLVYAGTLRTAGRTDGRLMFGGRLIKPGHSQEPTVKDESALAAQLLGEHFAQDGEPHTALLQRWQPGDPLIFRSPLPSAAR